MTAAAVVARHRAASLDTTRRAATARLLRAKLKPPVLLVYRPAYRGWRWLARLGTGFSAARARALACRFSVRLQLKGSNKPGKHGGD
jgi:hypothetical protein